MNTPPLSSSSFSVRPSQEEINRAEADMLRAITMAQNMMGTSAYSAGSTLVIDTIQSDKACVIIVHETRKNLVILGNNIAQL